jgi:hypothetical protein
VGNGHLGPVTVGSKICLSLAGAAGLRVKGTDDLVSLFRAMNTVKDPLETPPTSECFRTCSVQDQLSLGGSPRHEGHDQQHAWRAPHWVVRPQFYIFDEHDLRGCI